MASQQAIEIASFFVLVILFEIAERLWPARTIDRLAALKIDLLSFAVAVTINRLCTNVITAGASAVSPRVAVSSLHAVQSLPAAVKIGLALVVVDFVLYWIHRAQHRFDWLWRTHAWHHTIEHAYWLAGFRTSFLHSFIYNIPQAALPMLVFKLTPLQTGIGYSIGLFIQFWEHTNLRINIGGLQSVFVTPQYHRIHHSATRNNRRNLSATFSIWDRAFGTHLDPATLPDSFPLGLGAPVEAEQVPRMLIGL